MNEAVNRSAGYGWPLLWRIPLLLLWVLILPICMLAFLPGVRHVPVGQMNLHMSAHRFWMRGLIAVCGVRMKVTGQLPLPPCLVVANHITWFDIPVLHALWPMGLVAKLEIRSWPLIGRLAAIAGSIFIERGNQSSRQKVNRRMAARLRRGEMIGVFPEGGIHPGRGVKRFHARLFGSAIRSGAPVVPMAIRYWCDGDQHDLVELGRDDNLVSSAFRLLSKPGLEVQVFIGEPMTDLRIGRDALALRAQQKVTEFYAS